MRPPKHGTLFQRLMRGIKVMESGCWEWQGSLTGKGYGEIGLGSKSSGKSGVHRVAYEQFVGPIPDGLFVLHKCDNRRCANPAHLFPGTAKQNTDDMVSKGRARGVRGKSHRSAILDETQVRSVRVMLAEKIPHSAIAETYGVSKSAISGISSGRKWGWLK